MALARALAVAVIGVEGHLVEVEAHLAGGLPALTLIGLPDAALTEARDRIRAATISFPPQATLSVSGIARQLAIVLAPGLLIALGFPVFLDRCITRRRNRRAARLDDQDEPEFTDVEPADADFAVPSVPGQDSYDLPEVGPGSFELTHPYGDQYR